MFNMISGKYFLQDGLNTKVQKCSTVLQSSLSSFFNYIIVKHKDGTIIQCTIK